MDSSIGSAAALHLCGGIAGAAAAHALRAAADADRYLPVHQHPGRQHCLAIRRVGRPGHRAADELYPGALARHYRQRHRAHRVQRLQWHGRHQSLLPRGHVRGWRGGAGDRYRADRDPLDAPRHHAAADHSLQRFHCSHPAVQHQQPQALRAADLRPGGQSAPCRPGHRGVVHENAHRQRQPAQGHQVNGLAQRAEDGNGGEHRQGDGERNNERAAP